jgi:tRNA A37 threonylcarbamoyladenosine biosynthesis protein TsaE
MRIQHYFQHLQLSSDQEKALSEIESFLNSDDSIFLLNGYAGTGKTTLLGGLCKYLEECSREHYLVAPTGRAAMILNQKTNQVASTIHRHIYNMQELLENETTFKFYYGLNNNESSSKCVYLIDEASMISDVYSDDEFFTFGSGHLLKDLFEYVLAGSNNRKVIFIGDNAQLPPVNMNFSPALSSAYLSEKYSLSVKEASLKEVIRQNKESGILKAATQIRDSIEKNIFNQFEIGTNLSDISHTSPTDFCDTYKQLARKDGVDNIIVITHSNRKAFDYNNQIRSLRYGEESLGTLQRKDILLITRNNYNGPVEIFNGMFTSVVEVGEIVYAVSPRFKVEGGEVVERQLIFREVLVELKDSEGNAHPIKTTVIDNFLFSTEGRLHPYDQRALYIDFKDRMHKQGTKAKSKEFKDALRNDIYFNALQVKFGYAITCHKSQGGEWPNVMVDFKVFMGQMTSSYFRWAYTAMTRAKSKLNTIDAPHYNSLSQFVVNETLPLNGMATNAFYVPKSDDLLEFVTYRKKRIQELCQSNNVEFSIVEHANQLDINFKQESKAARIQLWYKKGGFSKNVWVSSNDEEFKCYIDKLLRDSLLPEVLPFHPKFEFQNDLHQYLCDIFKEEEIKVTNIVQKDWCDHYFIQTDADCALLEFYFDKKHRYTYMQPKSTLGKGDVKLLSVINKLNGN